MNFGELISETFRHRRWNYYSDEFIEKLNITTSDDCREFIRKFFAVSGKAGELNGIEEINLLSYERCQHIVYVFLLGAGIYDKVAGIKTRIDEQIQQYVEQFRCKSDVNFYFIWFLCCLFHDLGYVVEDADTLIDERIAFAQGQKLIGVPKAFEKETIKNYWDYRQMCHNKNDHGIYAGITMYKSLCNIRSKQEEEHKLNRYGDLCWEKELERIYNVASWIVMCHNIWFVQEKKKRCESEIYKKFNLHQLLLNEREYKIKMRNHSLFFFFCLIDTIEPIKRVKDYSLLEQIDVSFGEKEIIITSNLKCGCGDKYLKDVGDLNDWLIETHREDNRVTIELNLK
ncbi:MAG: hypothetical protein IKN08_08305 [Bacteroidales bacterium]|nr:hypothetical protein [Bacteroidales bacterium]MBR6930481.1 hypothetical protein [Bacteroidales bacterium]